MRRKIAFLMSMVILASVVMLAGCANAPPSQLSSTPNKPAHSYKIGPGDSLRIFVRNNPDLTLTVPVRPDGKISIPLVESMRASGKTPTQLSTDLQKALSAYVRHPNVTVIVTSFVGTYADQIRVVGEATRPQSIPYSNGMTLLDVMIRVGGLTRYAAGNRAKLVRHVKGQEKKYGLNLEDLLGGDISDNAPVKPGDVIIIPRSFF